MVRSFVDAKRDQDHGKMLDAQKEEDQRNDTHSAIITIISTKEGGYALDDLGSRRQCPT